MNTKEQHEHIKAYKQQAIAIKKGSELDKLIDANNNKLPKESECIEFWIEYSNDYIIINIENEMPKCNGYGKTIQ